MSTPPYAYRGGMIRLANGTDAKVHAYHDGKAWLSIDAGMMSFYVRGEAAEMRALGAALIAAADASEGLIAREQRAAMLSHHSLSEES